MWFQGFAAKDEFPHSRRPTVSLKLDKWASSPIHAKTAAVGDDGPQPS